MAVTSYTTNRTLRINESISVDPAADIGAPAWGVSYMNYDISGGTGIIVTSVRNGNNDSFIYTIEAQKRGDYTMVVTVSGSTGQGYGYRGFTATYNIKVIDVVNINMPSSITLQTGEEYTFNPQIQDTGSATASDLRWTSTNPSVARVDNTAKVRGVRPGIADITCMADNGVSATCTVTVLSVIAEDFRLEPSQKQISTGDRFTLTPVFTPINTTDQSVTYKSSDSRVATVDSEGNVTGVKEGDCIITGTTNDGSNLKSTCSVTVYGIYTIDFIVDGNVYMTQSYRSGEKITAPEAPAKTGYTFKEWKNLPATMPAQNLRVEAVYTINKYLLTYMVDGAEYKKVSVEYNALIDLSSPQKAGYTFSGWSTKPNSNSSGETHEGVLDDLGWLLGDGNTETYPAPQRMPANDLTLYGYFTPNNNYMLGDINGDKKVDVSDYIGVANRILGSTPAGFIEKAADVDGNGRIDVSDYIGIANIILKGNVYGTASSRPLRANTNLSNLDDVLYIEPLTADAGSQVKLSLRMKNSAPIRGFQFNLYLPEGVTVTKSNKGKLLAQLSEGRLPDEDEHTLTMQEQADGSVLFLCGSQYDECFTGNDGEIATITIDISSNISSGDHAILLKNIKLTETDISKYYETAKVETTLTIRGGNVDPTPNNNNVLYVNPFTAKAGSQVQMSLRMRNTAQIRGFQFNLYLPEGVTVAKSNKGKLLAELSEGRLPDEDDHTLAAQEQSDGSVLFLCGSQYDECFTGNDGEIATITLNIASSINPGDYTILLKNIKLTETDISKYYETAKVEATLTIIKTGVKGDVNSDNVVDVADIATIIDIMAGVGTDPVSARSADVNEDGTVDVADIATVIDIMAGSGCDGTGDDGGQKSQYTWDFGKGLSTETIANLIADDANWTVEYMDNDGNITGWKEATKHIGELKANGAPIAELVGIEIVNSGLSNSNNIIIRNSHIRLNRNQMKFKLPKLINGQIITINCQSNNSTATNRGLKASYDYMKRIAGPDDDIIKGADGLVRNVWQVVTDETNPVDIEFTVITGGINFFLIKIE